MAQTIRISYLKRTDGRTDGQTERKVHLLSCASQLKKVCRVNYNGSDIVLGPEQLTVKAGIKGNNLKSHFLCKAIAVSGTERISIWLQKFLLLKKLEFAQVGFV